MSQSTQQGGQAAGSTSAQTVPDKPEKVSQETKDKAAAKVADWQQELADLNAKLAESGLSVADVIKQTAHNLFGVP